MNVSPRAAGRQTIFLGTTEPRAARPGFPATRGDTSRPRPVGGVNDWYCAPPVSMSWPSYYSISLSISSRTECRRAQPRMADRLRHRRAHALTERLVVRTFAERAGSPGSGPAAGRCVIVVDRLPVGLLLLRFNDRRVALPAFVLQNDLLDRNISCISIQVGQGCVFGRPAAVHPIARHHLSSLVQKLDLDVLSKILQRHFCTQKRTRVTYQLGPIFELRVMRHPAFQYDGLKLREPRRFSGSAWITTLSVFDHFSAPLQSPAEIDPAR